MKVHEIRTGSIYHNGKEGVRKVLEIKDVKNPMGDFVPVVTYLLLAAKAERSWNSKNQQMESLIGTSAKMSLEGFASWAKEEHGEASAEVLLCGLAAAKLKLSPGELAYMKSVFAEAPDATIGTCITFNHTEGRAVSGVAKKGLVLRRSGEVELTQLGVAWLRKQAQRPTAGS